MKVLQKILAVVCAIAVTGTMAVPSSMVGLLAHAEDIQSEIGSEEQSNEENPDDIQSVGDSEEVSDFEDTTSALTDEEQPMSGQCGENVYWALDDEGTLTISGTGKMYNYFYSDNSPWYWYHNDKIKTVQIEQGVTSIGSYVFFEGNFTSVTIPHSVTSIGACAFLRCENLTSITIPNSVISINTSAFDSCSSLTSVIIPNNLTYIALYAFRGCTGLTSVTIPESVTKIVGGAFKDCSGLTSVYFAGSEEQWNNINIGEDNGNLTDGDVIIYFNSTDSGNTPPTGIFSNDEYEYMIYNNEITLIKYIGKDIAEITVPEEINNLPVVHMSSETFSNLSNLVSLHLPKDIADIFNHVLTVPGFIYNCKNLENIYIDERNEKYCDVNGVVYSKDKKQLISYPEGRKAKSYAVLDDVTVLNDGSFHSNNNIEELYLPTGLLEIGYSTFEGCNNLRKLNIPDSVTEIGLFAFQFTDNLGEIIDGERYIDDCLIEAPDKKDIIVRNGTRLISSTAFEWDQYGGKESVECIELPKSIISVNTRAFFWCKNLKDVYYHGNKDDWNKIKIGANNENLTNAIIHFDSTGPDTISAELYVSNDSDLNNVLFYTGPMPISNNGVVSEIYYTLPTFSIEWETINQPVSGDLIYLRKYEDDSVVDMIPRKETDNIVFDRCWEFNQNILEYGFENNGIEIVYNDTNNMIKSFEMNTKYYFDLQNVSVNGISIFDQLECKEKFCFSTGFSLFPDKQTFNFLNVNDNFWSESEGRFYHFTQQFYDNEINTLSKPIKNKINQYINSTEWDGSCNGLSVVMMLQNSGEMDGAFNKFQKHYEYVGDYPIPRETAYVPYGSRDIINFYQVLTGIVDRKHDGNDKDTISYILDRASRISSYDDIFQILYAYDDGDDTYAHCVNVLGRIDGTNKMYIYDSNIGMCIYDVRINGKRVYFDIKPINSDTIQKTYETYHIRYNTISDYRGYLPDNLKNKTKIHTVPKFALNIQNQSQKCLKLLFDGSYEGDLVPDDVSYLATGEDPADIVLSLYCEDYYEIAPIDGKLDYDILSENMYYAIMADNAEKSIVDAEEGIQLINNIGKFELTVTSNNDTYDMFDVMGNGQGDVICTYTDNGMLVASDISKLTVAIHVGLDVYKYILPQDVSDFIVTESGNKPAILIDTDNDGNFETNIVKQTITIPDNVTVTTALEKIINNGDEVNEGEILHIEAIIPDGKKLTSLTVNGVSIENSSTYIVGTENVVIAVTFDDITAPPVEKIAITIPENVVVTREGIAVSSCDEIHSGDILRIEAIVPTGKKLTSLTVNGVTIENGSIYTVGNEDVIVSVAFEDIGTPPSDKYFITIPSGITVTRNSLTLKNGDEISDGDVLNIKANIPSGYKLTSLTVNGKSIANGDTYTVGKENVIIAVSLERLTNDNPNEPDMPNRPDDDSKLDINTNQPFIISNSDKIGWGSILDELNISSDKTVMVDMNGTTVLPANILQVIKDNNIKLMLKTNDQVSWSIDGKDIERTDHDIDLKVIIGADNIPDEAIKKFVGDRKYLTLSIKHNGDFGFSAFLVIDVGEQYSNETATLYWFNDNAFKLEDSCKVQYGKAVLKFTHASDWIIAFGEAKDHSNSDNSNSDSSTDDTSRPIDARPNETKPDESNNSKPTTTEPDSPSNDEKDNPHTGSSRVSLATFLALVTSAALCLITRKQKR